MSENWDFPDYPDNWSEISQDIKERDNWTCQACFRKSHQVDRLIAHHITSLSKGGSNQLENLITVCDWCHGHIHPHEKKNIVSSPPSNRSQAKAKVQRLKNNRVKTASDLKRSKKVSRKTSTNITPILMVLAFLLIPIHPVLWIAAEVLLGFNWMSKRLEIPRQTKSSSTKKQKQIQREQNTVAVGTKVTLEREEDDESDIFKIVKPEESNLEKGKISTESPVGEALLGHSQGDKVHVTNAPSGEEIYTILSVES